MIPTWVFTNSFILNIIWFNVRSTQSGCRIEHLRDYLLRLFCKQPFGCSAWFLLLQAFITLHLVNTHWGGLLRLSAAHFHILNFIFWHLHSKWKVGIWRLWFVNCIGAVRWRWRGSTGPTEIVEWDATVIWHRGVRGAQHRSPRKIWDKSTLSFVFHRHSSCSPAKRWAKRLMVRNYAQGRQIRGVARSGRPRTKEGRRAGVQHLTWEERSTVGGETEGIWTRKWFVFFFSRNVTHDQDFSEEKNRFGDREEKDKKSYRVE